MRGYVWSNLTAAMQKKQKKDVGKLLVVSFYHVRKDPERKDFPQKTDHNTTWQS